MIKANLLISGENQGIAATNSKPVG